MPTTRKKYVLTRFPIVIDAVVSSLEVCLREDDAERWVQLHRLRIAADSFSLTTDNSMIHFFGPETDPRECPFVLVYDSSGVLRYRIDQTSPGDHEAFKIPEELNGHAVIAPSVRITFENMEAAEKYYSLIHSFCHSHDVTDAEILAVRQALKKVVSLNFVHAAVKER